MIRFLLWTTVASILSSIILLPLAWRAVLVGWATLWAVHWAQREWEPRQPTARARAILFAICGVMAGLIGGMTIATVELSLERHGMHLYYELGLRPTLARCLTVPMTTTLCVLGVGWCHLNRHQGRAWVIMLLALAMGSFLRFGADSGFTFGGDSMAGWIHGEFTYFGLGAVPFALLWLGAARIADREPPFARCRPRR